MMKTALVSLAFALGALALFASPAYALEYYNQTGGGSGYYSGSYNYNTSYGYGSSGVYYPTSYYGYGGYYGGSYGYYGGGTNVYASVYPSYYGGGVNGQVGFSTRTKNSWLSIVFGF